MYKGPIQMIGSISASIGDDRRYTTTLRVYIEGGRAGILVQETGAVGGMDGPGGAHAPDITARTGCAADAKAIVKAIKQLISSGAGETIKRYGKASKRFFWSTTRESGLSVARCQAALDAIASDK